MSQNADKQLHEALQSGVWLTTSQTDGACKVINGYVPSINQMLIICSFMKAKGFMTIGDHQPTIYDTDTGTLSRHQPVGYEQALALRARAANMDKVGLYHIQITQPDGNVTLANLPQDLKLFDASQKRGVDAAFKALALATKQHHISHS